jgi:Fur family ferric uptake transcriptional regulator
MKRRKSSPPSLPLGDPAPSAIPETATGHDHDHREHARELLQKRRLRVTAPRLAVLTVLLDKHRPTSAQELIDAAETQGMDHVTVYRTLNTLVDEGIAQAVGTTDRGRRFEVHACEGCRIDHPHLQCRRCGLLECLEQGMLPALLVPTEVGGFLIDEAKLYLYGLCPGCRVAKAP